MANGTGPLVSCESTRQLQNLAFEEGSVLSRNIPCDSVYRALLIRLSGNVETTFAAGPYVPDYTCAFDRLVNRIEVVVGGSTTVKSVRPWFLTMQQLFATSDVGERKSDTDAAAIVPPNPVVDGGWAVGATTEYTCVAESVLLSFEDPLARIGREKTYLNLKGQPTAVLNISTNNFRNIQMVNDATVVAFTNNTMVFEIFTIEAQNISRDATFADLKDSVKSKEFNAESSEVIFELNTGNFLRGIWFMVRDGDVTKAPSNNALTSIELRLNNSRIIKKTNFRALQSENRAKWGLNVPYAAGLSILDGCCFMDLLRDGDMNSALDLTKSNDVDQCTLILSTAPAGVGATYTNPVVVSIMTQELIVPNVTKPVTSNGATG